MGNIPETDGGTGKGMANTAWNAQGTDAGTQYVPDITGNWDAAVATFTGPDYFLSGEGVGAAAGSVPYFASTSAADNSLNVIYPSQPNGCWFMAGRFKAPATTTAFWEEFIGGASLSTGELASATNNYQYAGGTPANLAPLDGGIFDDIACFNGNGNASYRYYNGTLYDGGNIGAVTGSVGIKIAGPNAAGDSFFFIFVPAPYYWSVATGLPNAHTAANWLLGVH
jgi:hypothetical protein